MLPITGSGKRRVASIAAFCATSLLAGGCATVHNSAVTSMEKPGHATAVEVVPASAVQWGALNPARGAQGPRAADLWGDRTGSGATGFLVRFADGFSSPPHTHNVTYRGVVIEGLLHNDDPQAAESWMPVGSYWTQPAGEVHITSAMGTGRMAYIEIQDGPYLVLPTEDANDNGERAINVHASNVVWLDASSAASIVQPTHDPPANGPKISYLWGDPQDPAPSAAFVRLPADFNGTLQSDGASLRVVVVEGETRIRRIGDDVRTKLGPGSYVGSQGSGVHVMSLSTDQACVLYVRSEGALTITSGRSR